jgi:hypothetical protein
MLVLTQLAVQKGDVVIFEVRNRGEGAAQAPLTEVAMTDLTDQRIAGYPIADSAADATPLV